MLPSDRLVASPVAADLEGKKPSLVQFNNLVDVMHSMMAQGKGTVIIGKYPRQECLRGLKILEQNKGVSNLLGEI